MSTDPIQVIIDGVVAAESDRYTDIPGDNGGPTKYGITLATLAKNRPGQTVTAADVQSLTLAEATAIYRARYVTGPHFDTVIAFDPQLASYVVNAGVMSGPSVAAVMLQRVINVMNLRGKAYSDITADGNFGPASQAAMRSLYAFRGKTPQGIMAIRSAFVCLWGAKLIGFAEANPVDEDFVFGWIQGRVNA
jgi:lysozyme family protein